ncbi:hypothetical protein A3Q56_08152 [Intoshia linei]|uniref:Uncharacterized protein n=1 Tax=Intoshia linei TaxID=1819745 RepID=A0A177AQ53_9BILA|nr:hypothetical protein A3Q56_08152 [Intoshia linei]
MVKINKNHIECQHGKNECIRNGQMACVIEKAKNPDHYIYFIMCMFSDKKNQYEQCRKDLTHIDNNFEDCDTTKNDQIIFYLKEMEDKTKHFDKSSEKPKDLDWVPTIVLDNIYSPDLNNRAINNLTKVIVSILS